MLADWVVLTAGLVLILLLVGVVVLMSLMLKDIRSLNCFTKDAHVELDIKLELAQKRLSDTLSTAVADAVQLRRENLWRNATHLQPDPLSAASGHATGQSGTANTKKPNRP